MSFNPMNFVANLPYLLKGMLGLFIALGSIALTTVALNALNKKD